MAQSIQVESVDDVCVFPSEQTLSAIVVEIIANTNINLKFIVVFFIYCSFWKKKGV